MSPERIVAILTAGLRAAHRRLFHPESIGRTEYRRNLHKLYGDIEDEMFSLYGAICTKNWRRVYDEAGDVVARASMVVEMAEDVLEGGKQD